MSVMYKGNETESNGLIILSGKSILLMDKLKISTTPGSIEEKLFLTRTFI